MKLVNISTHPSPGSPSFTLEGHNGSEPDTAADTLPNIYIYNRAAFTLDDMGTSNQAYLPEMTDQDTGISHIVPYKGVKALFGWKVLKVGTGNKEICGATRNLCSLDAQGNDGMFYNYLTVGFLVG